MRVLQSPFAADGQRSKYKDVRGPDGQRFAKWRASWRHNMAERYGLCLVLRGVDGNVARITYGGLDRDYRRLMRNARKRERASALGQGKGKAPNPNLSDVVGGQTEGRGR